MACIPFEVTISCLLDIHIDQLGRSQNLVLIFISYQALRERAPKNAICIESLTPLGPLML
jgi:hypothetical protein